MNIIQAIIMGIIQGLAEFLPISSSGHLAIFRNVFQLDLEHGVFFEVLLHVGTLIAVFIAFRKDILELIISGCKIIAKFFGWIFRKKSWNEIVATENERFVMLILLSMVPTGVIAIIFKAYIEDAFTSILIPGIGLLLTSGILFFTNKMSMGTKKAKEMSYIDAILIGTAQGIATFPGISRSGSTIATGLFREVDKEFVTKFSFIMSIPAILGSLLLNLLELNLSSISSTDVVNYSVGMLTSAIVGYICIKTLLVIIRKNKLYYFSYYCFGAGTVALIYYFIQ